MKIAADLHVHSIASGHAYSTIAENVAVAAKKGLELIAITDHGPMMPGASHAYHFGNLKAVPNKYLGVEVLKGVEANIIDSEGTLDLGEYYLEILDIVLAGFHSYCFQSGTVEENTAAMINAMANPFVDIIVHPGNPEFKINPYEIVKASKEYGVCLEINNSSLGFTRKGSYCNCMEIARRAAEMGTIVSVGSDAHWAEYVGDFTNALLLMQQAGIKEEQIINKSVERVYGYLQTRHQRRTG